MDLLVWLIFGLIVGVVANMLDPRPARGGIIGAIVLGVVGALAGGYLGNLLFGVGVSGFNIPSLIVAVLGAMLVLFVGRMFRQTI